MDNLISILLKTLFLLILLLGLDITILGSIYVIQVMIKEMWGIDIFKRLEKLYEKVCFKTRHKNRQKNL